MIEDNAVIQEIIIENSSDIRVFVKREDLIHPFISGNKYRKLKYNLKVAKRDSQNTLLTYGGAFSNHIAATAYAGKLYGFNTIGVIRGEELKAKAKLNPTLEFAKQNGMHLHFVSRQEYKLKQTKTFQEILEYKFGDFYNIPEGGTNAMAIKGCEEILDAKTDAFDYICCAVGTGGTIGGVINSAKAHQKIIGFPALKGGFLSEDICKFVTQSNWQLNTNYHFGGYAKVDKVLIDFINRFKMKHNIPLDPIYTGKMCYGVLDMITKHMFKANSKILMLHTGGLQGIEGINSVLTRKGLPLIHV